MKNIVLKKSFIILSSVAIVMGAGIGTVKLYADSSVYDTSVNATVNKGVIAVDDDIYISGEDISKLSSNADYLKTQTDALKTSYQNLKSDTIQQFSATSTYSTGDYVIYEGFTYKAKTDVAAGAFNSMQWIKCDDTVTTDATAAYHGLMSATDKAKLDDIDEYANDTSLVIGGTATDISTTTTALANGNVYLNEVEDGTVENSYGIQGTGITEVTTDASGNITVDTSSTATGSANGLMSSGDKSKMDAIEIKSMKLESGVLTITTK